MSADIRPGTALPWALDEIDLDYAFEIYGPANGFCAPIVLSTTFDEPTDARYIVHAANLYPELLAALSDSDLSEAIYAWANEKNIGRKEYDRRSAKVEKMRAALRKARGEPA